MLIVPSAVSQEGRAYEPEVSLFRPQKPASVSLYVVKGKDSRPADNVQAKVSKKNLLKLQL